MPMRDVRAGVSPDGVMMSETGSELAHLPSGNDSSSETNTASDASPDHSHRRSEWWRSSTVIAGEVMGTGVLSLPYACSRLGWALGLGASVLFGCTAIYSGHLLSYAKNHLYPDATSFADLAHRKRPRPRRNVRGRMLRGHTRDMLARFSARTDTGGPRFGRFTRVSLACGWAMILPYYLIACAASLNGAFPWLGMCYWQWSLIVMACAAPALQYRSFHGLSILSLLSTGAIIIVVIVLVVALVTTAPTDDAGVSTQHYVGLPPGQSFLRVYSSLGAFIFAYQGQSVFLEIMREMREPRHFPRALYSANGLMMLVYSSVSAAGYGSYGESVSGFLPDTLPAGIPRTVVGVLLAFHTLVSYLLTGQPLHRTLHLAISPHTADQPEGAFQWACLTLGMLLLAFLVANVIPFFADVQDLLGNILGAPTVFGWPAFFFLRGSALRGRPVATVDRVVCTFFLLVLLPAFTLLGTANAVLVLVEDLKGATLAPFQCQPQG